MSRRRQAGFLLSGQWLFAAVLLALPCALAAIALFDARPANTHVEAMARGQYERAARLLQPEVALGNPAAQSALANLHNLGLGLVSNPRRAAELYHDAASQGHAAAQLNLGHLYRQGRGVQSDNERAFGWYVHADIAGSPWAEYYLGQLSSELTLTPLQMASAKKRWLKLPALVAEPL